MREIAEKFLELSLEYQETIGSFPISIGPDDSKDDIEDWVDIDVMGEITDKCHFLREKYIFSLSVWLGGEMTIDGVIFGENGDDELEFNIALTKKRFVDHLTRMMLHYKEEKWYISIHGGDLHCTAKAINSAFNTHMNL